jgi:hypothetical protein
MDSKMNERIKQMARQSGATDQNGNMATTVFCFTEMELDRFAELIVRECITVIENKMPDFTCKEDYENLIRKAGRMDAIDEIEQHFGVEQ